MVSAFRGSAGAMADYVPRGSAGRFISAIGVVLAVIIVLHIIFVLVGANPGNAIVNTDATWASYLAAWFKDLFTPSNYKLAVVLNYGLAAIFYIVVGRLLGGLVSRV